MPRVSALVALALLLLPAVAGAKFNRTFLVPAYDACPGSSNCNPPKLSSVYTFDSIAFLSPADGFIAPGKLTLMIIVKGLRDGSGNLVNGTITANAGSQRVTILGLTGTLGDTSPLAYQPPYVIEIKNGSGRYGYKTPDITPKTGMVVNALGAPVIYDPDGKLLATTGARSKPAH